MAAHSISDPVPAGMRQAWLWAGLLVAATLLLGLAASAGLPERLDRALAEATGMRAEHAPDTLLGFMIGVSWIGGGVQRWLLVALLCVALWRWVGRPAALAMVFAALGSNLASTALKFLFGRGRPDLVPHLDSQSSASFPSGHATNAASVYVLAALMLPPRWRAWGIVAAMAAILLNGCSRMMLGVHWFTDIVGGTMLGTAFALMAAWWWYNQRQGLPAA